MNHSLHTAYIAFGSNVSPSEHLTAVFDLFHRIDPHYAISSLYQTEAVGFVGEPFLNFVVKVHTSKTYPQIQEMLKRFESNYESNYVSNNYVFNNNLSNNNISNNKSKNVSNNNVSNNHSNDSSSQYKQPDKQGVHQKESASRIEHVAEGPRNRICDLDLIIFLPSLFFIQKLEPIFIRDSIEVQDFVLMPLYEIEPFLRSLISAKKEDDPLVVKNKTSVIKIIRLYLH